MERVQNTLKEPLILSLDAEKPFDSARWKYLYWTKEQFGFDHWIITGFKTLYKHPNDST